MSSLSIRRQAAGLAAWLVVSFAASAVGAVASLNAGDFYRSLDRPDWAPRAWLFGPVWTVLYTLQAVAAWLVWRERGFRGAPWALSLFFVQLAANALWTWLFFAWHLGAASFGEILLLEALIVATVAAFGRVSLLAAALLAPYAAWVGFATALTWSIWQRNPAILG